MPPTIARVACFWPLVIPLLKTTTCLGLDGRESASKLPSMRLLRKATATPSPLQFPSPAGRGDNDNAIGLESPTYGFRDTAGWRGSEVRAALSHTISHFAQLVGGHFSGHYDAEVPDPEADNLATQPAAHHPAAPFAPLLPVWLLLQAWFAATRALLPPATLCAALTRATFRAALSQAAFCTALAWAASWFGPLVLSLAPLLPALSPGLL